MKQLSFLLLLLTLLLPTLNAQKRILDHADFDTWNRIVGQQISNDGQYVLYHLKPGKGDQQLFITNKKGATILNIDRAVQGQFSEDSRYVACLIKPAMDSVNALRRKKVKKDKLPKDTLAVYDLNKKQLYKFANVSKFSMPQKWSGWLSYQLSKLPEVVVDTTQQDSNTVALPKPKKFSKKNGHHVICLHLKTMQTDTLPYVLNYTLAEEAPYLVFNTTGIDSSFLAGVYHYNFQQQSTQTLSNIKGKFHQLTINKTGQKAAFVVNVSPKEHLYKNYQLRYWNSQLDTASVQLEAGNTFLANNWQVSPHRRLSFSDNDQRLFFGVAPPPIVQDTNLLPEEIIQVEIWNYQNGRLHTQQNVELNRDKKKSYLAVLDIPNNQTKALGTTTMPSVRTTDKGNSKWALGISYLPYEQYVSWEGFPRRQDIYLVDVTTGTQELIQQDLRGGASISPKGNYIYWYNAEDSTWTVHDNNNKTTKVINKAIPTSMADERNDMPNYPYQYGVAGWTENDAAVILYDRFDLWLVDPKQPNTPQNLTNGRSLQQQYRYVDLDPENLALDNKMLLHIFNEKTRQEGYARLELGKPLQQLVLEDFKIGRLRKAQNSQDIIYTKENFQQFPNLLRSTLAFSKATTISDANPQQKDYLWGSVELYNWNSLDGKALEGLLYKPANFDPQQKYPTMVYFYERNSNNLHRHQGVVPSRSIINPAFYASRGYVVFIPDIVYRDGYPGESCYNAVIPGVTSLIEKGFVDKENIGVQGHSWGGYQIAYLVTKTNIFKAAEAGAPVSNMTSAYGGIRWGSGYSRMFQYEHTQSRIGGTLWEYPMRYIENSPIFFVDKIETPLLILHNDKDGHVPWYQGIELYVVLRRLGKPAWMLNYNGEPHWPTSWQNIRDLNVRMQQYFDHYLKGAAAPEWLYRGIPAIEKGINKGYKLQSDH